MDGAYLVTARKWRPTLYKDVVGQEHVSQTLRNAVLGQRLHHAYIFNGPRGVGKTTSARILAKAVNCPNLTPEGEPCNECSSCLEIGTGRSIDVIEIDGASNNSVDDVRNLRENAQYPPVHGKYKLYIIDEVHMLSTSAFNALLKTLEEPPRHLIFVFATTEPHKIPATILSRCQRFDFRRMQVEEVAKHLRHISEREGVNIDDESLVIIAKKGDGSMRDSQSIYDQVRSFCGNDIKAAMVYNALNLIDQEFFFELAGAIRRGDVNRLFVMTQEVFLRGYDMQECLSGLAEHYRNLLTVLVTGDTDMIEVSGEFATRFESEAAEYKQTDLMNLVRMTLQTEQALRFAPQPRLRFEFALVEMARMPQAAELSALLHEIQELKQAIHSGATLRIEQSAAPAPRPAATPTASAAAPASAPATSAAAPARDNGQNSAAATPPASPPPVTNKKDTPQSGSGSASSGGVSAASLESGWSDFVRGKLSNVLLRGYLNKAGLVNVQFFDGRIEIEALVPTVGDTLDEQRISLQDEVTEYYGGSVEIRTGGGSAATGAIDMFGSMNAPQQSQPSGGASPGKPEAAPRPAAPDKTPAKDQADLPELDRKIIDLFNASEIASR